MKKGESFPLIFSKIYRTCFDASFCDAASAPQFPDRGDGQEAQQKHPGYRDYRQIYQY